MWFHRRTNGAVNSFTSNSSTRRIGIPPRELWDASEGGSNRGTRDRQFLISGARTAPRLIRFLARSQQRQDNRNKNWPAIMAPARVIISSPNILIHSRG